MAGYNFQDGKSTDNWHREGFFGFDNESTDLRRESEFTGGFKSFMSPLQPIDLTDTAANDGFGRVPGEDYPRIIEEMTEEEFRSWIDQQFRGIFAPYESQGGIPIQQVLVIFQYNDYGLPKERRQNLFLKMDANKNGRINFQEFRSTLIMRRYEDLHPLNRAGLIACLAGNPGLRKKAAKLKSRRQIGALMAQANVLGHKQQKYWADGDTGGGYVNGAFHLEPDGVWPSSKSRDLIDGKQILQYGQIPHKKTIKDTQYIPQLYLDAYNCKPPPLFIPVIVIIQIAIFIYYAVLIQQRATEEPWNVVTWTTGYPFFSPLVYDPTRRREAWRFISYFLIHQGIEHILFNCLVTLIFGVLIEWINKFWRIIPIYFAGVLLGSLSSSVFDPYAGLVGSSGGVYALLGSHLALVIMNWEEMQHDWTNCTENPLAFFASGVVRLVVILIVITVDFAFAIYRRYALQSVQMMSFVAHLGGFLAGILIGIPVLRNFDQRPWERVIFWISIVIFFILVTFAILWNIFFPNFPPQVV